MRVLPKRFRALVLSLAAFGLLAWMAADGQNAPPSATASKTTAPSSSVPAQGISPAVAPNTETEVLNHVTRVLQWFHQWGGANAYVAVPGDELFVEYGQNISRKVVDLEFKSALAQADILAHSSNKQSPPPGNTAGTFDEQNLLKLQQNVNGKLQALKTELDAVNKQIATARAKNRPALESQRDTLQGQIALAQVLQNNLQQLTSFANSTDAANGVATELSTRLRALQQTIPTATTPAQPKCPGGTRSTAQAARCKSVERGSESSTSEGLSVAAVQGHRCALHNGTSENGKVTDGWSQMAHKPSCGASLSAAMLASVGSN